MEKKVIVKKVKTREEILASLKLAEVEEGRTGLVEAFMKKTEPKVAQPKVEEKKK